jgi:adenylate cyclase
MRAGVSSGPMIVGDAGSTHEKHRASDFTVLGDTVNLGARLESANKALGSLVLLNGRARELIGDTEFLVRPMGNLRVVGKTEGVMTFEPLCRRKDATDEQLKLAAMTTRVVELVRAGQFQACMDAAIEMQLTFGEGKLARLYIELCNQYLVEPPTNGWDGQIVLFEK